MRRTGTKAAALLGGVALIGGAALATAPLAQADSAPAAKAAGTVARFEGRTIDLSKDWGAAKACTVWRTQGVVECYRTQKEQEQAATKLARLQSRTMALASCSTPLRLYEHGEFNYNGSVNGRTLSFYDRGYWQNLTDFGFNDEASSYRTGSCGAHLAEHTGGQGYWYPGNTNAWYSEGVMYQGWNDRISSVYNT